jgi:hypothetical protein
MADVGELGTQILGLMKGSLQTVYAQLTAADRQNLVDYSSRIAQCTIDRRATQDPNEQARLEQEIIGFSNAVNLMADRYLLIVNHEAKKTALEALKIAAEWGLKIIIAAVV